MMIADRLPTTGTMDFNNGTVIFNKISLSENMEEVTFSLKLKSGERAIGTGRYDKQLGRMVKWIERY